MDQPLFLAHFISFGSISSNVLINTWKNNLINIPIHSLTFLARCFVFFTLKPDDILSSYIDQHGFNTITRKNRCLDPLIDEIWYHLGIACIFTRTYAKIFHYQNQINKGHLWKQVFEKRYELFEYQLMLFRLGNIFASFELYIHGIFELFSCYPYSSLR